MKTHAASRRGGSSSRRNSRVRSRAITAAAVVTSAAGLSVVMGSAEPASGVVTLTERAVQLRGHQLVAGLEVADVAVEQDVGRGRDASITEDVQVGVGVVTAER